MLAAAVSFLLPDGGYELFSCFANEEKRMRQWIVWVGGFVLFVGFACGDVTSVYFTYDYNYRWLVLEVPTGLAEELPFLLEAEVHSPY